MKTLRGMAAIGTIGGFLLVAVGWLLLDTATGQIIIGPGVRVRQPVQQPATTFTAGGDSAAMLSGIKLVEKSEYRQFINVAKDCIKDKAWNDAVTALQTILDTKEDSFIQVKHRDNAAQEKVRWTSVKYAANTLLGTMPEEGLDVYEVRFGGKARQQLAEALRKGDRDMLADVAQRYLHTRAGYEAYEQLATFFLDRGQFFTAALRFEKLLAMNPQRYKPSDLTLFRAALASRCAGKDYEAIWKRLEPSLRDKGGLKIDGELVNMSQLQLFLQEAPQLLPPNPRDWPFIRGDLANSGQGSGSPPLLNLNLWKPRSTVLVSNEIPGDASEQGKEAKVWLDQALEKQGSLPDTPIMAGFFPIVANGLFIFRTHSDVRAIYLKDGVGPKGEKVKAGDLAWSSIGFDASLSTILRDHRIGATVQNWLNQYFSQNFSHFVYENTLLGTLSCDHRLVYAIDDLAVPALPTIFQQFAWNRGAGLQSFQEIKPFVFQNSLQAFDLQTGNAIWQLGNHKEDDGFRDSHFLGPPLPVGGKLYVLNEKNTGPMGDGELRLVCIDPTKFVAPWRPTIIEPIQTLAMVQQHNRITHDISRRINAVHLAYGEGILVCPTNAGEVLGIDLMTRSLAWSYPYRDQAPTVLSTGPIFGPIPRPAPTTFTESISANWKSAPPAIVDGKVVFTAPDAHSIHCINLRDGEQVWKKPKIDGDLFFAGVINGKVLIVGNHRVRALNLADGADAWNGHYVKLDELMPSGQGVAIKNLYYLPLAKKDKGEVIAIDVDKGLVKARNRATISDAKVPGNLVFAEGAVLSVTPTEVVAYQQLTTQLAQAHDAVVADPNNPEKLLDRGELRLADGQIQPAVDDLHQALNLKPPAGMTPRVKQRLYEALSDLFQTDFPSADVKYLDEYRALCQLPDNPKEREARQAKFFRVVGKGREDQGNLVEAFQMYRDFSTLPINKEGVAQLDDPIHKVPAHIWFRGRIAAMMAKAQPEQRQPLEKQIAQEWQQVLAQNDLAALRQFVGMFDLPFTVGREARLQLADMIMQRKERHAFLEAELNLQQLRSSDWGEESHIGGRALAALALLEEKKSTADSMKQAAAYYRELARTFPKAVLRDSKTGEDLFNELATDKRFLPYLEEPGSFWTQAKIGVRELPAGTYPYPSALQGFVFQPEGDLSPLVKNYRLVLDTANLTNPTLRLVNLADNSVRWSQNLGGQQTHFQYFQTIYRQQQNNNNNYYHPHGRYRFFQVKGHLAVVQVGTMAYCLDLDNPRLLWQHSLIEGNISQPHLRLQLVRVDQDGNLVMLLYNQFNRQQVQERIGHVGAVQASYAALATQKGLVVLDPLRGTPVWTKTNVSTRTNLFGDERHLFLVDVSDNGMIANGRVLRASDGERVEVPDFSGLYRTRLVITGRHILAWEKTPAAFELHRYDILTGKDVWRKTFNPGTLPLQTSDPTLTGVIQPDGKLLAFEVATGKEIFNTSVLQKEGRVTAADLNSLVKLEGQKHLLDQLPLLLRDRDRFYVALNKPIDTNQVQGGIMHNNFSNGLQCALVNGWFMAFHDKDGKGPDGKPFKRGDLAWHSIKPITHQMVVLEQFQDLPMVLFTARYHELINGGAGGSRWVSNTQSLHRNTGKMIYEPGLRGANVIPQYYGLNIDQKNSTINVLGPMGGVQHFIDDGRKLEPAIPGAGALVSPQSPVADVGQFPPPPPPIALPQVMPRPIFRIPPRMPPKR